MSETTEIIGTLQSERSKVESWRLHVLMEAGYPLPLAERIAARWKTRAAETTRLAQTGQEPARAVAPARSLSFAPSGLTVSNLPGLMPANGHSFGIGHETHRSRSYTPPPSASKSGLEMELSVYP